MPTSDCREAERSESWVEVVLSAWARPLASAATVCCAPAWLGLAASVERSLQNVESWAESPLLLGSGKTASMEVITWFVWLAAPCTPSAATLADSYTASVSAETEATVTPRPASSGPAAASGERLTTSCA